MKHILAVSHCILNTASKVAQDESGLAEEYRQRDELLKTAIEKGVQLLQLPCPEFMLYGARRWGHVKDQFDNPFFRAQCRSMLEPVMMQLCEYASEPQRFCLLGITAVEGSPSCGAARTCRAADWGGEFDGKACGDLSAAVLGPVPGMIVGSLSNIITGLIYSVSDIPFFIVNLFVGLITGLVVKKWKYSIVTAIVLGLVLAVVCPAIGTPIGLYVYGGFNGSFSDVLVMSLVEGGKTIFQASFLRNIASNLIDKIGTAVIAWALLKALSQKFYANFDKEKFDIVK